MKILNNTISNPYPRVVSEEPIGFIIGCGRTGTHMLGYLLDGPSAKVCFEAKPLEENGPINWHWTFIHAISRNPRIASRWWERIVKDLDGLRERYAPKLFIDKSNQLMGWTDWLLQAFPNAKLIGITRLCAPTVRSMVRHQGFTVDAAGIMGYAESYEAPHLFSGVMNDEFFEQDAIGRLAWRWAAARKRLYDLKALYPESTYRLYHYEDFVSEDNAGVLNDLATWLNVTLRDIKLFDKNEGVDRFFSKENKESLEYAVKRFEETVGPIGD